MTKQIEITEKKTKTIEIEVPSYYNEFGVRVAVTDHVIIKIWPGASLISFVYSTDKERYSNSIDELLQYRPQAITEQEFDIAFNSAIKCLTEQYQLSKSMEPSNKQQEEQVSNDVQQATEQQNAQESAAQDAAVEVDSEEGSIEG